MGCSVEHVTQYDCVTCQLFPSAQNHQLRNLCGTVVDDITIVRPQLKKAPPTCVVWWETMDERQVCITGSEVGEVSFFDVSKGVEVCAVTVSGCIDHLLLARQPDHSTHLLVRPLPY